LPVKNPFIVASEVERYPVHAQLPGLRDLRFRAQIRRRDLRKADRAEQRGGHTGARQSDNQHALASELDRVGHGLTCTENLDS
jgi:hypothetical protein